MVTQTRIKRAFGHLSLLFIWQDLSHLPTSDASSIPRRFKAISLLVVKRNGFHRIKLFLWCFKNFVIARKCRHFVWVTSCPTLRPTQPKEKFVFTNGLKVLGQSFSGKQMLSWFHIVRSHPVDFFASRRNS
jgi:hypothetical protein